MKRQLRKLWVWPMAILGLLSFFLFNCAPEPKYRTPALGETISIQPIAVNKELGPSSIHNQAIKLNVMWGGRAINANKGDPMLHFYDSKGELKYSHKWSDLEEAYRRTACSESMVATMDGYLMGNALLCDGSLDLNEITMIKAVDARGKTKVATSWGVYRLSEEVTAVSIGLY
ncbi:MAG: hypothetical protein ACOH5I_10420 [Oligoflexus sp.]